MRPAPPSFSLALLPLGLGCSPRSDAAEPVRGLVRTDTRVCALSPRLPACCADFCLFVPLLPSPSSRNTARHAHFSSATASFPRATGHRPTIKCRTTLVSICLSQRPQVFCSSFPDRKGRITSASLIAPTPHTPKPTWPEIHAHVKCHPSPQSVGPLVPLTTFQPVHPLEALLLLFNNNLLPPPPALPTSHSSSSSDFASAPLPPTPYHPRSCRPSLALSTLDSDHHVLSSLQLDIDRDRLPSLSQQPVPTPPPSTVLINQPTGRLSDRTRCPS